MISIIKTPEGRLLEADTSLAHIHLAIQRQAHGKQLKLVTEEGVCVGEAFVLFREEISPTRQPEAEPMPASREPLAPQMQRLVEARVAVCNQCDKNKGIRGTVRGYEVWRVKCSSCGCAGLSMRDGECPEEKWPTEVQSSE